MEMIKKPMRIQIKSNANGCVRFGHTQQISRVCARLKD